MHEYRNSALPKRFIIASLLLLCTLLTSCVQPGDVSFKAITSLWDDDEIHLGPKRSPASNHQYVAMLRARQLDEEQHQGNTPPIPHGLGAKPLAALDNPSSPMPPMEGLPNNLPPEVLAMLKKGAGDPLPFPPSPMPPAALPSPSDNISPKGTHESSPRFPPVPPAGVMKQPKPVPFWKRLFGLTPTPPPMPVPPPNIGKNLLTEAEKPATPAEAPSAMDIKPLESGAAPNLFTSVPDPRELIASGEYRKQKDKESKEQPLVPSKSKALKDPKPVALHDTTIKKELPKKPKTQLKKIAAKKIKRPAPINLSSRRKKDFSSKTYQGIRKKEMSAASPQTKKPAEDIRIVKDLPWYTPQKETKPSPPKTLFSDTSALFADKSPRASIGQEVYTYPEPVVLRAKNVTIYPRRKPDAIWNELEHKKLSPALAPMEVPLHHTEQSQNLPNMKQDVPPALPTEEPKESSGIFSFVKDLFSKKTLNSSDKPSSPTSKVSHYPTARERMEKARQAAKERYQEENSLPPINMHDHAPAQGMEPIDLSLPPLSHPKKSSSWKPLSKDSPKFPSLRSVPPLPEQAERSKRLRQEREALMHQYAPVPNVVQLKKPTTKTDKPLAQPMPQQGKTISLVPPSFEEVEQSPTKNNRYIPPAPIEETPPAPELTAQPEPVIPVQPKHESAPKAFKPKAFNVIPLDTVERQTSSDLSTSRYRTQRNVRAPMTPISSSEEAARSYIPPSPDRREYR